MLRFFAYKQVIQLLAERLHYANEKFGVIFTLWSSRARSTCLSFELWLLPARAWRDTHVCTWHQKIQDQSAVLVYLATGKKSNSVAAFLWEPVRRLCVLRHDTSVQYAAC